ncbi:hypothetical protein FEM48_Zijuj03G0142400 [Ziziphus jujuba var. spinosa]|uniref:Glutamate receptor 2.8-like n=1 Tax=Ziziphus jujuba var. spinosa TaxID=714518 RepID=A0A978VQS9_ZIZJJ|nr:hypothetical protein FEM48_Zijuj03G0142400 [Ziziphus jujuba var. spinosa]
MKEKATRTAVSSSLLFFIFAISIAKLFSADFAAAQNTTTTSTAQPISVGLVIDFERWVGKLGLSCIEMALSDFYASHGYNYKTRLHIDARDSKNDVVGAASAGSPLVPDISRAILNVTEGGKTKEIEKKWFGQVTNYQDFNSQVSSNVLGLESFWGLFLITGVASLSALIVFAAMFIYQQRQIITDSDRVDSKWEKVLEMLRIYDHKDLSSHTFKKNAKVEEDSRGGDHMVNGAREGSPEINFHPSPSTYSIHTDQSDLAFLGEQETPPREFGSTNQAISGIEVSFVAHQETPNYSS